MNRLSSLTISTCKNGGEVPDLKVLAEAKGESLGFGSEAYILEAH